MVVKRISLIVLVVMLAGAYFATESGAAPAWYACKVEAAGPGWGAIYVQLTDKSSTFTKKWFSVPAANAKEVLAVALTAMSSGIQVLVYADPSVSGNPAIYTFYLTQ